MTLNSNSNAHEPIPAAAVSGAALAPDAPVMHCQLTIKPGLIAGPPDYSQGLTFVLVTAFDDVPSAYGDHSLKTVQEIAQHIADQRPRSIQSESVAPTPYDIEVKRPTWVILELDPNINWEFAPGKRGVTAKQSGFNNENYGLTFVKSGASPMNAGDLAPEGCTVLYFAVAGRHAPFKGTIERGFNFEIDFFQTDRSGLTRRLPLIFDPNVPNGGGASFP